MSLLHDHLNSRNLRAFQLALNGGFRPPTEPICTGGTGKSWTRGVTITQKSPLFDVNARDWLGRTALHLACASVEYIDYVRVLLRYPDIDVNIPDSESLWTPLHRALYSANLSAACVFIFFLRHLTQCLFSRVLLLQHPNIDALQKDLEGYTAFDLYNSTLNGTKPGIGDAELYTWGGNRNAALGLGDADDRTYPVLVRIKPKEDPTTPANTDISLRFSSIFVRQIRMSRLHTAIITNDTEGNVRLCGFGSGGRLGSAQHTQFTLKPVPSFNLSLLSVAIGQDHTLALTTSGEVFSWGLNRFSQLGYVVDVPKTAASRFEEPIQHIPKKVVGLLKKEVVLGVAASKNASACWTKTAVFTWGTNLGQLGYDKSVQPVQVLPRAVTKFKNPVIELSLSDNVLAALLVTRHVECIWNDRHIRILFPMHSFPIAIQPYRPRCVKDAYIIKVTCCDDNFAALSSNGEVFTFSPDSPVASDALPGPIFNPQKVWSLRKKFSAVKDVALGSDGTMIVCTESGHVYVRKRNVKKSNKTFSYDRVPLQRISQVCANSTGGFAALRVDHRPCPIEPTDDHIAHDVKALQPYLPFYRPYSPPAVEIKRQVAIDDEESEDVGIASDIESALELLQVLSGEKKLRTASHGSVIRDGIRLPHDADVLIHFQSGQIFPVHRIVLVARSPVMECFFSGSLPLEDSKSRISLRLLPAKPGPGLGVWKLTCCEIDGCHPLTALIFLRYLYSDELISIWDRRVGVVVQKELATIDVDPAQVRSELQGLGRMLDLSALNQVLEHPVKNDPLPTMARDMQRLFDTVQRPLRANSPLAPDVVIRLADKEVYTHSALLRSRTPLFASLFDLEDWTVKRWETDGTIRINMTHLNWHIMRFVFSFMCCGLDQKMFNTLEFVESVEDLIQFMFNVAAAANELLLDRLVLICASVILARCNLHNACSILEDATYYHIGPLVERIQEYIVTNMETFLQSHMLDEISDVLIKQLAQFVKTRQIEKSPFSRSDSFVNQLLAKHAEWLAEHIPDDIVRTASIEPSRVDEIPVMAVRTTTITTKTSGNTLRSPPSWDDIFIMDDSENPGYPASYRKPADLASLPKPSPKWKPTFTPRVDMKNIIAETRAASKIKPPLISSSQPSGWLPTGMPPATSAAITSPGAASASTTRPVHPRGTGLGPLITPKRQSQPSTIPSNIQKGGSTKVWSEPPRQPTAKSAPAAGMSFVAIQDAQQQAQSVKDIQTIREIQEEEHSLQLEAEFLKWWTAEEERIKYEALALAEFENAVNKPPRSSPKNGRRRRGTTVNPRPGITAEGSQLERFEQTNSGRRHAANEDKY